MPEVSFYGILVDEKKRSERLAVIRIASMGIGNFFFQQSYERMEDASIVV